ncbi:MAG: sodium:solute symporter, partial [Micrococcaceae bacterium]|nr:sodium:solute symporter [Micrococcaceae bacterium]
RPAAGAPIRPTASGALIAAATVARNDVTPFVASWFGKEIEVNTGRNPEHDVAANRYWVLGLGAVAIILAILVNDVVAALTIAYDILVGGLLVAILGGLLWKRGNGIGAALSMAAGTLVTLTTMITLEALSTEKFSGVYANEPIYYGLGASLVVYVLFSLLSPPTRPEVARHWSDRVAGRVDMEGVSADQQA